MTSIESFGNIRLIISDECDDKLMDLRLINCNQLFHKVFLIISSHYALTVSGPTHGVKNTCRNYKKLSLIC